MKTDEHAKVELAVKLKARGLNQEEIAGVMNVSRSTVSRWFCDPDGEKQRKRRERYAKACPQCGKIMDTSGGYKATPTLCASCFREKQHEDRYWTRERIIAVIQDWAKEHGRSPTATEWSKGSREKGYPGNPTVQREFGSWNAGMEAAGFKRRRSGDKVTIGAVQKDLPELIEELREVSTRGVAPPTNVDPGRRLLSRFHYHGLTWMEACREAGVKSRKELRNW